MCYECIVFGPRTRTVLLVVHGGSRVVKVGGSLGPACVCVTFVVIDPCTGSDSGWSSFEMD